MIQACNVSLCSSVAFFDGLHKHTCFMLHPSVPAQHGLLHAALCACQRPGLLTTAACPLYAHLTTSWQHHCQAWVENVLEPGHALHGWLVRAMD
jgi:hypothetical protein